MMVGLWIAIAAGVYLLGVVASYSIMLAANVMLENFGKEPEYIYKKVVAGSWYTVIVFIYLAWEGELN